MRPNKLRQLLNAGQPTIGTRVHSTWPSIVELIGHTGLFDYVEFLAEYAPFDLYALDNFCRAVELFDYRVVARQFTELIGKRLGIQYQQVSAYERDITFPRKGRLIQICELLNAINGGQGCLESRSCRVHHSRNGPARDARVQEYPGLKYR